MLNCRGVDANFQGAKCSPTEGKMPNHILKRLNALQTLFSIFFS